MSTHSASNANEPPQQGNRQLSSLSSLPEEIVLSCLARVPRNCHLKHRWCLKNPKIEKTTTTTTTTNEYCLVPTMLPSHPLMTESLSVSVGSEIYFVGSSTQTPSTDLWILDTRSGKFVQGPSMKIPRSRVHTWLGVIDGKIYVIGVVDFAGPNEEIQVEIFDPESKIWKFAGHEKVRARQCYQQFIASLEQKIYMVYGGRTGVYNPRQGKSERLVHMVNEKLVGKETRERLREGLSSVCVVENILYAHFESGLMWFDTKLSLWRKLVSRDGKEELFLPNVHAMAEYEGKLVVFKYLFKSGGDASVEMFLFALDRVRETICGTIEWSGIVASVPYTILSDLLHCLVVSE
ncbi:unnamed protein product [Microthlaspi erraticum]|uniref:FKB95-like N-terminal Kelch domain-containing protein n=1 Tax=Microthlaspi erraticum TaxID=1685480 RepID=A0A6D2JZT8_9BRAS|nr:unnamed protein product [Microthlaspi erraticum]